MRYTTRGTRSYRSSVVSGKVLAISVGPSSKWLAQPQQQRSDRTSLKQAQPALSSEKDDEPNSSFVNANVTDRQMRLASPKAKSSHTSPRSPAARSQVSREGVEGTVKSALSSRFRYSNCSAVAPESEEKADEGIAACGFDNKEMDAAAAVAAVGEVTDVEEIASNCSITRDKDDSVTNSEAIARVGLQSAAAQLENATLVAEEDSAVVEVFELESEKNPDASIAPQNQPVHSISSSFPPTTLAQYSWEMTW